MKSLHKPENGSSHVSCHGLPRIGERCPLAPLAIFACLSLVLGMPTVGQRHWLRLHSLSGSMWSLHCHMVMPIPTSLCHPDPPLPPVLGPASVQALTSPLDLFCPKASDCSHFHLAHLQPILNFVIYSMNNYCVNYSAQMRRPRYFINVSSCIKFFMRIFHAHSEQYCILHSKMGESVDLMLSVLTTIIKTEPFTHESWVKY